MRPGYQNYLRDEYKLESESNRRQYVKQLSNYALALDELGDKWGAKFMRDMAQTVERQATVRWGLSEKQDAVLRRILEQHGDLLYNAPKRQELVRRREEFRQKLTTLQEAAEKEQNRWLQDFLSSINQQIDRGRPLSDKQKQLLQREMRRLKVAYDYQRA